MAEYRKNSTTHEEQEGWSYPKQLYTNNMPLHNIQADDIIHGRYNPEPPVQV